MPSDPAWRPSSSAVHLLHRASQAADRLFVELAGTELTPRQFVVLATVADADGANQATIVELTGIDRSSIAELVKRLVDRGVLRRRRSRRDTRSYVVTLTAAGRQSLRRQVPAARRVEEALLAGADRSQTLSILQVLAERSHPADRSGAKR